jgi:hypothetical protein
VPFSKMLSIPRIAGVALVATASSAQAQLRRFTPVPDTRIGVQMLGGQRDFLVSIAPNGRVVVAARYGGSPILAFDSLGNQLSWKIPTGRDAEIGVPVRLGWIASTGTTWVADQRFGQIALIDSTGRVVKSIENPSWIHPSWAERRKYPVFAAMQALAVYKDETMLLLPGRERALLDTPGYDRSSPHLLRATWSGAIQRSVAMVPEGRIGVELNAKGCRHIATIPFAARPIWGVSPDGSRIVVVTPGVSVADSGTVHVTAIGERGDTVFSRALAQPAVRVPQATIDNLLASQAACGGFTAEAIRDSLSRLIPPFASFVMGLVLGSDQTTWVMLRAVADTSMERTAIGLDERGNIIGAVALPANQTFVAADRNHIWTIQTSRMRGPATIVRHRLEATPAPPPRSGRAGAPSSISRPPG